MEFELAIEFGENRISLTGFGDSRAEDSPCSSRLMQREA